MTYPATLFLLACLISGYAVYFGGFWHLLHWFSLSWLSMAVGHAWIGARIFGKRRDGTLPIWSKIIHLPFLLYTWLMWRFIRSLSRENATDQITPDLIIGRRLEISQRPQNVEHYVDLTAEMEDPKAVRESDGYLSVPILDGSIPSPEVLSTAVSRVSSGLTYVHCAQGHGRSGLFALAFLSVKGHIHSFKEGMKLLKEMRPGVALNPVQKTFIRNYIAEHQGAVDAAARRD